MKIHRKDNTFEINHNGLPYNVTAVCEPENGLYAKLLADYKANPADFTEEADIIEPERQYTTAEAQDEIEQRIQARLDSFAQTLTYSNLLSACSYATSKNPTYAIEGQYCCDARDDTWDAAFAILTAMQAQLAAGSGIFTQTQLDELWLGIEAQLPALAWPEGSRGYTNG